jgi:hypothetical protein
MRDARVNEPDARGLMPLGEARSWLRSRDAFQRDPGEMVDGTFVLDADGSWAALLSLQDADEFVREARRLTWKFDPRGMDNVAPFERYGDEILPWLADHLDAKGNLFNRPWCVVPCLLAIGSREAFELVWQVRGPDRLVGVDKLSSALVRNWIQAHPTTGFVELAKHAKQNDGRARSLLKQLADRAPREVRKHLLDGEMPKAEVEALLNELGIAELRPETITGLLDTYANREAPTTFFPWPFFHPGVDDRCEYHGMRMMAARSRSGDGWGIVLEKITGCHPYEAQVERYFYGNAVNPGMDVDKSPNLNGKEFDLQVDWLDDRDEDDPGHTKLEGRTIRSHAGSLELHETMIEDLDLRPGESNEGPSGSFQLAVPLRAYLERFPGALWSDPRKLMRLLELGDDAEWIVVSEAFEHVVGPNNDATRGCDRGWDVPPSQSKAYASLARALCARDGSLFEPGISNLEWRRHACQTRKGFFPPRPRSLKSTWKGRSGPLRFVGSEGGPLLVVPEEVRLLWRGTGEHYGRDGGDNDYDRLCARTRGTGFFPVVGTRALVLDGPDATAWWPLSDQSGLFVRWIGADSEAQIVRAVEEALPSLTFTAVDGVLVLARGQLTLFDSALAGDDPHPAQLDITLWPGRYWVSEASLVAKDLELALVRLTRLEEKSPDIPPHPRRQRAPAKKTNKTKKTKATKPK